MTIHFGFKIVIVLLVCLVLLLLNVWLQAEAHNRWAHNEFHKQPRLPHRYPQPSALRKLFIALFNLNH